MRCERVQKDRGLCAGSSLTYLDHFSPNYAKPGRTGVGEACFIEAVGTEGCKLRSIQPYPLPSPRPPPPPNPHPANTPTTLLFLETQFMIFPRLRLFAYVGLITSFTYHFLVP